MMKRILKIAMVFLAITGCGGKKDVDKIGDAQICLDGLNESSTAEQANACMAMVDGLTSSGSEGIRCSVGFIREGFANANRYIAAFDEINGGTSGSNVQALMGLLAFTSAGAVATDFSNAGSTFQSCLASYAKGPTLLASFSYFTMGLMNYFVAKGGAGCSSTPTTSTGGYKYYDLSSCMTNISNVMILATLVDSSTSDSAAASAQASIGAVIVSTYELSCSTGTGANKDLCNLLSKAITAAGSKTNTRGVAVNFFGNLVTP